MAFIRIQNLKFDNDGHILRGTASISVSEYVPGNGKCHSHQVTRERLGKIIWLADDRRSGIFSSPARGIVGYDASCDQLFEVSSFDTRVSSVAKTPELSRRVIFGDAYVLLEFLRTSGIMDLIYSVCGSGILFHKLVMHTCHSILKDSSKIACDDFIDRSFLRHLAVGLATNSLHCDTPFFTQMADDGLKERFFRALVGYLRDRYPEFGRCCYVDSTPLPNGISNNPFNALCSHGVSSCSVQTRLVLILDEGTGMPVWFTIIPGNVVDLSTLSSIRKDVRESLGLEVSSLVLDAGYASKDTLIEYSDAAKYGHLLVRMPAKKEYPYKKLYRRHKEKIGRGKYAFVRQGHTYFGYRQEASVFGCRYYAFLYVDQENALLGFRHYMTEHPDEYERLTDKDKDFYSIKYGYFVLLSNTDNSPKGALDDYFGRAGIEGIFKTAKEYLGLLPIHKWTDTTVRGKLMHDMINTVIYLLLRKSLRGSEISISRLVGRMQSLMCLCARNGIVSVDCPSKNARETMKLLNVSVNNDKTIDWYRKRYHLI